MTGYRVFKGSWQPSRTAFEAAVNSRVRYENGPLYDLLRGSSADDGSGRVSLPAAKGTQLLGSHVAKLFDVGTVYYTRRKVFPSGTAVDLHVAGRAIDFMTHSDFHKGCEIANYLTENCDRFGVQFVVFAYNRFSAGRKGDARFAAYTGPNPHTDHVHCELTVDSARLFKWASDL